jgi:hypothetical protein
VPRYIATVVRYQEGQGAEQRIEPRKHDQGWVAKAKDRACGQQNGLIYRLLGFTGVLRIRLSSTGVLSSLRVFLGVVFAFATDYVLPLPVRWPYLFYRLDDHALRRHIHSMPPHYMELPEGYTLPEGLTIPRTSAGKVVCQLRKCLYGLKQILRAWYTDIDANLSSLNFIRSNEDYNLYISKHILLLLFVNDILLFTPKLDTIA